MSDSRKTVTHTLTILLFVGLFLYGLFESRRYLTGPTLTIHTPSEGAVINGPSVSISGFGENLSYLYINGKQAYLNERGELTSVYTPPPGYTVLTAEGRDRFGRSITVTRRFIVN